ncbi:hypothetical protein Z951_40990 [Streptomyces sp. PRh5]|nr:hypothetical protein Z951_40990 [Streptomyces sp. PRh5]
MADAATAPTMVFLIGAFGDGMGDPASAQVGPETAGAVGPVRDQVIRAAAWGAVSGSRYADAFQQRASARAVIALTGAEQHGQGAAAAVAGQMDFLVSPPRDRPRA